MSLLSSVRSTNMARFAVVLADILTFSTNPKLEVTPSLPFDVAVGSKQSKIVILARL